MEQETSKSSLKEISTFKYDDKSYKLMEPSAAMVKEAKRKRGIRFVEAIKAGMFTKKQLQDILMERSPEFFIDFNQSRKEVLTNIADTEELLEEIQDPSQLESLSHILVIYRAQLVEQEQMLREMFESTAEQVADEEKNEYLVFAMLRTGEGEVISSSYEDFLEEASFQFFDQCKYQLLCWEHSLDPQWQETLPEAKAMLKAQTIRDEEVQEKEKSKKKTVVKKKTTVKKKSTAKRKTVAKKATKKKAKTKV